jgi:type IV secretory pathway VirB2 component (pilin)
MNRRYVPVLYFAAFAAILMIPSIGYCSVESSLMAVQSKLITTILPLAAVLGLVFAGLSFVAGSPNARNHLVLAIMGAVIGFGAPSIIQFIQQLVN